MATVYFNKNLSNTAMELIKSKSTVDKIKANEDIAHIDNILDRYIKGYGYNQKVAEELDERIRREYRIIAKIDQLSVPNDSITKADFSTSIDPLISKLNVDRYGIQFDVLLKDGIVKELEDFVERVE